MLEFQLAQSQLLPPLLLLQGAVEKKQAMPILANVLLRIKNNELHLSATDTEVSLTAIIALAGDVQDGETTVPGKKFIDILRTLKDSDVVKLKEEDGRVILRAGRSRFSLTTLPARDFPLQEDEVKTHEFSMQREALALLLQSTYFSMAQLDVRYYLNGVLIELSDTKITAVATDGHRLALSETKTLLPLPVGRFILPRKGVLELLRLIGGLSDETVSVSVSKNHFYLSSAQYLFTSKLIEGKFPNYRRVIPSGHDKELLVNKDILKQAISRVSILANEKFRAIEFRVTPSLLTIVARNQEQEEALDELEVETTGESLSFGVNALYLIDVLNHLSGSLVRLSYSTPQDGILVSSPQEPSGQYVIMPLKL